MKTKTFLVSLTLVVAALLACAQTSFNLTNTFFGSGFGLAATPISGWPTNTVSAATGLPQANGAAIDLHNYNYAQLYFTAYVATNSGGGTPSTNNFTFTIIRGKSLPGSGGQGAPTVYYAPNPLGLGTGTGSGALTNLQAVGWETWTNSGGYTFTVPLVSSTAGAVCWFTNLDQSYIGPTYWVGVASCQLNATNACLTNVDVGLITKVIPIRYP